MMPHLHAKAAMTSRGEKRERIAGTAGEDPSIKAARMAGPPMSKNGQGDSGEPEEVWTKAPPRQISNYGRIKE
jgi:hypothetical protein